MNEQEYFNNVGMEFKLERIRQHLTMRQLAAKAKVNPNTVQLIENALKGGNRLTTLKKETEDCYKR